MILQDLKKQIAFQWRVQSFSKNKPSAQCVAYIDARDVQKILDEVCGAENWQDDYKEANGLLFAGIGIKVGTEWIWKWDTGSESDIEKEKGHVSDSFKRAAVKWGVGRFLYDMPIKYVKASAIKTPTSYPYVIDDNGKQVWDLTEYINGLSTARPTAPVQSPVVAPVSTPPVTQSPHAQAMQQAKQEARDNPTPPVESYGICKDCGQPNKKYTTGKIGCSAYCWKNPKPAEQLPVIQQEEYNPFPDDEVKIENIPF